LPTLAVCSRDVGVAEHVSAAAAIVLAVLDRVT
jgi:hypothetical protein